MWNNRNYSKPAPKPKEVPLWSSASQSLMKDIEVNWGGFTAGGRKAISAFGKRWAKQRPTEAGISQKPLARQFQFAGGGLGWRGTTPSVVGMSQDPSTRQITFGGAVLDRHYDREAGKWKELRGVTSKTPEWEGKTITGKNLWRGNMPVSQKYEKHQTQRGHWWSPIEGSGKNIRRISEMRNEEEDLRDFLKSERSVLGKVQTVGTAQTVGRRRATLVGKKASR